MKLEKTGALEPGKKRFFPGPGDYKPSFSQSEKSLPKYSLKGRLDTKKHDEMPGPGSYQSTLSDKKAAPKIGFGSSPQREPLKSTLGPGPGGYHIPYMVASVPSYSLPNKEEDLKYVWSIKFISQISINRSNSINPKKNYCK